MSPKRYKPFKPFKPSNKSPFDHDGPSHKALKEALDWIATHDPDTPFSRLIREVRKPAPPPSEEPPNPPADESVEAATISVETAAPEAEPQQAQTNASEAAAELPVPPLNAPPNEAQPLEQAEKPHLDGTVQEEQVDDAQTEEQVEQEIEAAEIRAASRPARNPLINSRRLRRVDLDDPAKPSRHRRRCIICQHDDMYAIEQAFLEWHRPNDIKHDFHLPNRMCLYRHARATGLFEKRARNLRFGLEKVIEESTCRAPSADSIIRAIRVYSCIDSVGHWVESPRQLIITYNHLRPESAPKKLLSAGPAPTEIEKRA